MEGKAHLYCGDGKGKTTACMGLILRALGRKRKVVLVQFLKGLPTGEIDILSKEDNIKILRAVEVKKFTFQMTDEEKKEVRESHDELLKQALEIPCDLLVLDEAISTYNLELVDRDLLKSALTHRKEGKEIVLTGRDPDEYFLENCDYVTEMKCIRHPYDTSGLSAREGIEY